MKFIRDLYGNYHNVNQIQEFEAIREDDEYVVIFYRFGYKDRKYLMEGIETHDLAQSYLDEYMERLGK